MAPLAEVFNVGVDLVADLGNFRRETERGVGDAAEQAAETGGKRFKAAFSAVAAASGLAVGAALAYGITQALSQQNASRLLAAQLGASPGEAARLGKLAGSLYASGFGANMEEVNAALRGVVQNGIAGLGETDEAIKSAAANVTNLAALLGEDTARVSAAISQMLRTGLAKTSTEAFDVLVAATQKGINKSEDLLDTLNEYGTEFRELGLNGTQAMGLISQAIQAGARDSDTAADALKEFSIRAQDGSKLSADAFTALGLNAQQAFAAVAAGGAPSAEVLDQVLDRLRAMPASAERTALAVALFGTKAEDLADSLFAMDLTSAADQLGNVAGAAQRAGDTMASSATAQFDTFTRAIKQDLIEALMVAVPAIQAFGEWVNRNRDWVVPLGGAILTLGAAIWVVNAALSAYAIAQGIATAVASTWLFRTIAINTQLAIYFARMAIVRGATIAWTAVQWALNAAFIASPIGIIVLALGALVAAVVLAWKHSDTFRSVVLGAWEAIKAGAAAVWDFLKPIFAFWWESVQRMGQVYLWLWNEIVRPAMQGIQLAIQVAWAAIQIVFQLWRFYIMEIIVPAVMWLWNNAIKPTWDLIVAQIRFAWSVIKVIWDALVFYVRNVMAPVYTFLWNAVKAAWEGLSGTISAVWNNAIKPVFDFIVRFITQDVPAAWRRGVDLIGFWWNALKDLAKAPVRFVIETVVNKGIIGTFNKIAEVLPGVSRISPIGLPEGFAEGGAFYSDGYSGPVAGVPSLFDNRIAKGPNGEPIKLATGEYVVRASQTAKHLALLEAINAGADGYAVGGLIGIATNPAGFVRDQVEGLLGQIPGGGVLRQVGVAVGRRLIDGLIEWVKSKVASLFAGGGGGGVGANGLQAGISGVLAALRATFGNVPLISGLRPGDRTLSGNISYHSSGRAIDIAPVLAWAQFIHGNYGPLLREHITPWQHLNIHNGRPHTYTGAVWNQHNFAGGNAHIHAAMARGGLVKLLSRDRGGPVRHGEAFANMSGKTEQVTTGDTMLDVIDRLERLIEAVEQIAPGVGRVLGAGSGSLMMARTR